jgi:hypothetical protein
MTLKLPSNTVPFAYFRPAAQTGGLYRAALFDLPRATQPKLSHVFSAPLAKAMAEDQARIDKCVIEVTA